MATVKILESAPETGKNLKIAIVAWLLAALFYFYQYMLRTAPSIMMPQLAQAFGISSFGVASILALSYYGYAPFSLVAGVAMDRLGPRKVLPIAAAVVGAGALLFATAQTGTASVGRLLQGAGGGVALVGAIYIATGNFSPSKTATLIGATQMFGMAGGSAGQFAVGSLIAHGVAWDRFWIVMGAVGLVLGAVLLIFLPRRKPVEKPANWLRSSVEPFGVVFRNPQSILCGLIAGLLFIPTTIFDMIWGVRYLQEAHGLAYASAVMRSSAVPVGWIVGCPLLGLVSDRIGRRKPVIVGGALALMACLAWILFGRTDVFPPYSIGLASGLVSGAAMLPYTVIKEANPPQFGGTATGVVSFLNVTVSALLGPVFGWVLQHLSGGAEPMEKVHYQMAFAPLLLGVAVAIVLALFLKETGPAVKRSRSAAG